ncbi:MAG: endolytic transglycosylase MltG [Paracoccaceae bacterium]
MRDVAANALTLLILLVLGLAVVAGWGASQWRGEGPLETPAEVTIPRGASIERASAILEDAGAISDALIFRLGARYSGLDRRIKAGEFAIPPGTSMEDVLRCLVDQSTCRRVTYPITVVEGMTVWEAVEALRASEVLTGEIEAVPPEGTLAPDTYAVTRGDDRAAVLARMTAEQAERLAEAWAARAPDLPISTPEEALILASIIEKETALPEERETIAGVFANRLRRGMRLQTDPTVIYGITEGKGPLGRGLRRSELDRRTPWNTYRIDGLPPTPIANPGLASLKAAVRPEPTEYVFFVADGTGGHVFAETYAEHQRNVAAWRRIEAERN